MAEQAEEGSDASSLFGEAKSDEEYLSDIEEDESYLEEVKDKGIEYESSGS